jgi:hypothetical protein
VLLEHVRQHLVRAGLGLRQAIDWMMFVHSGLDDASWSDDFATLTWESGLERLAVTLTYMSRKWLGLPDRISWCDGADDGLADLLLARLLEDGNFGRQVPVSEGAVRQLVSRDVLGNLQRGGIAHWEAARRYPALRPLAWVYQLGHYASKGVGEMLCGRRVLGGLKSGLEKKMLLRGLGISLDAETEQDAAEAPNHPADASSDNGQE